MSRLVSIVAAGLALAPAGPAGAAREKVAVSIAGVSDGAVLRRDARLAIHADGPRLRSLTLTVTRDGAPQSLATERELEPMPTVLALDVVLDWTSFRLPNGAYAITASASTHQATTARAAVAVTLDNAAPDVQSAAAALRDDGVPVVRWCAADVPDLRGYDVERQVDGGAYVPLARVQGEPRYADADAPPGDVRYRVSAVRNSVVNARGRRSEWRATDAVTVRRDRPAPVEAVPDCPPAAAPEEPALREVSLTPTFLAVAPEGWSPKGSTRIDVTPAPVVTPTPAGATTPGPSGDPKRPAPPGPPTERVVRDASTTVTRAAADARARRAVLVTAALLLLGGVAAALAARALRRRRPLPVAQAVAAAAPPAAAPPSGDPLPRRPIVRRVVLAGPRQLGAAAALVAAVSGALFVVRPNLQPSTANAVGVTNVAVEPDVTLLSYVRHPAVRGALDRVGGLPAFVATNCGALGRVGTVVHVDYEVKGYADHRITVRWSLIDGKSGRRLMESEGNDPLPLSFRAGKRDADIGSWELWVPAARAAKSVKARIELYDTALNARLAFKDSPAFRPPSRADQPPPPCS